jgi:enamine deaminase RidA (YjgF/YER057c/UK114 family)
MSTLLKTLEFAGLKPKDVVQVKVFLAPASAADEALREVKKFFPGQPMPPVVFVEWLASVPVEIELTAALPLDGKAAENVRFLNPPDVRPSADFSRIALVQTDRQIFVSGLTARKSGNGEAQARDVFAQLKPILAAAGTDFRHLAKASYYVSDDEASSTLNKVRSEFLDPERPPAASKVTIHAVGLANRTLTLDVIAVAGKPE